jgi:hypothetical protein
MTKSTRRLVQGTAVFVLIASYAGLGVPNASARLSEASACNGGGPGAEHCSIEGCSGSPSSCSVGDCNGTTLYACCFCNQQHQAKCMCWSAT